MFLYDFYQLPPVSIKATHTGPREAWNVRNSTYPPRKQGISITCLSLQRRQGQAHPLSSEHLLVTLSMLAEIDETLHPLLVAALLELELELFVSFLALTVL